MSARSLSQCSGFIALSVCVSHFEPVLLQTGTSVPRSKKTKRSTRGHEVEGQGQTRPKLQLEAWRRHHSRPVWWSRFLVIFNFYVVIIFRLQTKQNDEKASEIHTADGFNSLIEGSYTLTGGWTTGWAAAAAAAAALGVVIATYVTHVTTRSQLSLSHYIHTRHNHCNVSIRVTFYVFNDFLVFCQNFQ